VLHACRISMVARGKLRIEMFGRKVEERTIHSGQRTPCSHMCIPTVCTTTIYGRECNRGSKSMNLARTESTRPVSHQLLPFRYVVAHHAPAALSRQSGRLLILSLIFLLLSLLLLFHYISLDDNERVRGKNWPPIVNSQDLGRCRRVSCSTWALLHPPIFEPCVHSSATSKLRHQAHSRTSPTRIRTRFLAGPSKPSSSHSRLFDPSKTWHRDPSRHCLTATRDLHQHSAAHRQ
jgi:hypothetical protein